MRAVYRGTSELLLQNLSPSCPRVFAFPSAASADRN